MRKTLLLFVATCSLLLSGCSDKEDKDHRNTFMFWCFRKEIVSTEYHVPDMATPAAAAYLQSGVKGIPGYVDSTYDLDNRIIKIRYKSSVVRSMNFEEAIASGGFSVNGRPARSGVNIPEGLK